MRISLFRHKQQLLTGWGFISWESREFARQYTTKQIRSLPYMKRLTSWRRLYVSNFRKRGFSNKQIISKLKDLYTRRDWLKDGKFDPWAMLRHFRKEAIADGDYIPPKRKGSHHKVKGISKSDIVGQKKRSKQRRMQAELDKNESLWVRAVSSGDYVARQRLERERDRIRHRYGQY